MSDKFNKIYDHSIKNPEKFWQEAAEDIFWFLTYKLYLILKIK